MLCICLSVLEMCIEKYYSLSLINLKKRHGQCNDYDIYHLPFFDKGRYIRRQDCLMKYACLFRRKNCFMSWFYRAHQEALFIYF